MKKKWEKAFRSRRIREKKRGDFVIAFGYGSHYSIELLLFRMSMFVTGTRLAMPEAIARCQNALHLDDMGFAQGLPLRGGTSELLTGKNVGVAVIDTGVNLAQRDWLQKRVLEVFEVSLNGAVKSVYVQGGKDRPRLDVLWHGTVMAELIGRPGVGMAPEVDLYCYCVPCDPHEDEYESPTYDPRPVLHAFAHAEKNPAVQVVSLSLNSFEPAYTHTHTNYQTQLPFEDVFVDALTALQDAGKIVILTAGNRPDQSSERYETGIPGRARPGVTVGSAALSGGEWERSKFSLSFERMFGADYIPDVYASGEVIPVCDCPLVMPGVVSGTSASTAITSGLVALGVQALLSSASGAPLNVQAVNRLRDALIGSGPCVRDPHVVPTKAVRAINVQSFLTRL
ncbi:S8/S53 family peptidase [Frigoriglobus tundricola]|uniref:Peptidase S8/S53 domain-containing protein n=1 Tax=Frigoriglobus tundricola TaxID=2774151 RepID=A0A6M5YT60_9BACT|nr:S8/S53 family peptidase [Frigoriglobus tundricola]QJW97267.1 hypothetical protein FTUN_4837 [Frigoriglobus tundricola]